MKNNELAFDHIVRDKKIFYSELDLNKWLEKNDYDNLFGTDYDDLREILIRKGYLRGKPKPSREPIKWAEISWN